MARPAPTLVAALLLCCGSALAWPSISKMTSRVAYLCNDAGMIPSGHGGSQGPGNGPYSLTVSSLTGVVNGKVTVTIGGTGNKLGIMMQGRKAGPGPFSGPVGSFSYINPAQPDTKFSMAMCPGSSTVVHVNKNDRFSAAPFNYILPSTPGQYYIYLVVLPSKRTYYILESAIITVTAAAPPTRTTTTTPAPTTTTQPAPTTTTDPLASTTPSTAVPTTTTTTTTVPTTTTTTTAPSTVKMTITQRPHTRKHHHKHHDDDSSDSRDESNDSSDSSDSSRK